MVKKNGQMDQLNIAVIALVALVAIVALAALVMNSTNFAKLSTGSQGVEAQALELPDVPGEEENLVGDARIPGTNFGARWHRCMASQSGSLYSAARTCQPYMK